MTSCIWSVSRPKGQLTVHRGTLGAAVFAVICGAVVIAAGVRAAAADTDQCVITQVTSTTQAHVSDYGNQLDRESLSGDGTRLAFVSDRDLTGDNPDGRRQVFFYDATTGDTRQVTSTRGGGSVMAADGSRVAFNTDGGQVHAYDPATEEITQLTSGALTKNVVSISADGARILYLVFDQTMPYGLEILDTSTSSTIEVAADAGLHVHRESTVISPDGTHVAFASRADITGHNPDGSAEVFLFDSGTEQLTQITSPGVNSDGSIGDVQFTDNGATVVFSTNAPVAGPDPGSPTRSYRYQISTGMTSLVPEVPAGRAGLLVWSPDGARIAGTSNGDPTGANPEHNYELFSYAVYDSSVSQLTATASTRRVGGVPYSVSTDGSTVAFLATANLANGNPDHNSDIYLATTCDPPPRPDMLVATAVAGRDLGGNVYSSAPRPEQRAIAIVARGATRKFFARIQNDRTAPDTFTLSGADAGSAAYQIAYEAGTTDITDQIEAGTYTVGPLEPGESATIKIKVTATSTAGNGHRVDLLARSDTNPAARDAVRAKVTRS